MIYSVGTTQAIKKVASEIRKLNRNVTTLIKELRKQNGEPSEDEDDENLDVIWGVECISSRPDKLPEHVYSNKDEALQAHQKDPDGKRITKYEKSDREWELVEWWIPCENGELEKYC